MKSSSPILRFTLWVVFLNCSGVSTVGQDTSIPPTVRPENAGAPRLLALGDSYTIGEGVPPGQSWPLQLTRFLRQQDLQMQPPVIIAKTGWTTRDLLAGIDRADLNPPYDLVSLLIGVNDQYQARDELLYQQGLVKLLDRAMALAGGDPQRVIVVSIPDYSVTPFGQGLDPAAIRAALDRFNLFGRTLSARAGVRYIDITPISREAGSDPSLLTTDQLHPSGKMYARWVPLLAPIALAKLRGETD